MPILRIGSVSVKNARRAPVVLAMELAVTLWLVPDASLLERGHATLAGVAVAILAPPRGPIHQRCGTWDRFVR